MRGAAICDKVNSLAMRLTRSLGVNLHPTSLPGGRLGPDAYAFVDWLAAAGASYWQILPLNPPDEWGSPYASASAFACSPELLADPDARVAPSELRRFEEENAYWIGDWIAFAGGDALAAQVRFEREWSALRQYAAERGVSVVGDLPIYVAEDSCDHVAHPEIFLPRDFVAGAPPDDLNEIGQKWGNPLYDWDALARSGYRWWIERLRRVLALVDLVRIDHFRAFAAYWSVPVEAETARDGHWEMGPGAAVFRAAERELGELPVVVEDLGLITPDVEALRDELGFPGMAITLWAFERPPDNPHRFENHRVHEVVYTSTHDTDTLAGAFPGRDPWELLELTLSSRAALAMVPVQDVLGLGSEARMNRPGVVGGNWAWRLEAGQLGPEEGARLRRAAEASGRA
jgi:4-alpha-glucanotransferase